MRKWWLALIFSVLGFACAFAETVTYSKALYEDAVLGDRESQYLLGIAYFKGLGIPQDSKEAKKWFQKASDQGNDKALTALSLMHMGLDIPPNIVALKLAAEKGDPHSQYKIGWLYSMGVGVERDYLEASKWMHKAAEQGDADAEVNLGMNYMMGTSGFEKNSSEALKWTRKAAEQGLQGAQCNLGAYYENEEGWDVIQDYKEAFHWYTLAAAQGNDLAQLRLGRMYVLGKGVAQDFIQAYKWFDIAAAKTPEAKEFRDKVSRLMTSQQLQEGQRLARAWQESYGKNIQLSN
jgi:TPR repeat protein